MIGEEAVQLVDLRDGHGERTIGGKAAGLQRLAAAGIPVPPGRIIPAETPEDDIDRLAEAIVATWPTTRLAVRSSGVGEDSAEASFAGQFETVLNVEPNPAEVASAVRRVRASVGAAHAESYRRGPDMGMAVLVMPMIDADQAGIAFTRHPVSGERMVVIEAVVGLADKLASGEAVGERWTVADSPRRAGNDLGVLDADTAMAVADLARRVEEAEGAPQDIEWALASGTLHLLQARPITALDDVGPIPMDDEIPPGPWEWDSTHSRLPVTPLVADVFPEGMKRGSRLLAQEYGMPIDHLSIRAINGYFYIQVVPPMGKPGQPLPPPPISRLLFRVVPALRRREQAARRAFSEQIYRRWHERWLTERRPQVEQMLSDWFDMDVARLPNEELAKAFDQAVELVRDTFSWNMVTDPAYLVPMADLHRFVSEQTGAGFETCIRLVAGSSPSEYRRSAAALAARVSPEVRRLTAEGGDDLPTSLATVDPGFATAYREHQRKHGMNILGFDLDQPTILEDPVGELRRIVSLPTSEGDVSADATALAAELTTQLPPELRDLFGELVAEARRTYWIREEGNAVFFSTIGALRLFMLEVGRRLASAGQAGLPDHAAFLTVAEMIRWLHEPMNVAEIIRTRRGERRWAAHHTPPASFGAMTPPPGPESLPPHVARTMEVFLLVIEHDQRPAQLDDGADGVAASPGVHTGPVRVVRSPHAFSKVQPGDVLVAPLTTSSWEVLFPHIGALVTEGGGTLSHPAIVAREYGLPAVVGCEGATTRFHDGQVVTVDGSRGTITPVES